MLLGSGSGIGVECGLKFDGRASSNFGPGNLNFLHCQRPGTSNIPLDRPDEAAWLPERRMDILPPPNSLSFQFGTSQLKLCRPNRRSSSPSPSPSPTKQTLGPHFHVSPPGPDLHGPPWRITSPVRHHSTANQHPSPVLTGPPPKPQASPLVPGLIAGGTPPSPTNPRRLSEPLYPPGPSEQMTAMRRPTQVPPGHTTRRRAGAWLDASLASAARHLSWRCQGGHRPVG